jgi:hypothetical protein
MSAMLLVFSHALTDAQKLDAKEHFGIETFVSLPEDLQLLWSNIPPELENLDEYLLPLKRYISKEVQEADMVLVQGDFGATCSMVRLVKSLGATALYATTKRIVSEKRDGGRVVKRSLFEHVRFREY